jgi:hypothetical protein
VSGLLDSVREACARVARGARFVRIDEPALERWGAAIDRPPDPASLDPAHHALADADTTLAYVVTLDAINFGSGWFPVLEKIPGHSGYRTLATHLKRRFERDGAWSAAALREISPDVCAEVFGQQRNAAVAPLMQLFARALNELGAWLDARHGGSFEAAVAAAGGSAERLAEGLAEMPLFRDVARHAGRDVPLYKRAQLCSSDLAAAFGGEGPGRFDDLERLTIFADNLVPHVLRRDGVLVYDAALAARIERGELLEPGSPEEVEIRAVAVAAVERAVPRLRARGIDASAQSLDHWLWNRGQAPEIKAHPRHRCRTPCY